MAMKPFLAEKMEIIQICLCTRADPASKFREGDFSNALQSSLLTSSLL